MAKRIFSLTAVCLLGFMLLPAGNKSTQTLSAPDAPAREATSGELPDERLLFPELTDSDISEIHIRAGDDCAFDFSVRGELSVNGQKADGEVFSTLLDQLTADCFIPCEDFEPRGGDGLHRYAGFFRPFLSEQQKRQIRLRRRRG